MLIAFLTSDLVFPSRVVGVAAKIGARMEIAASEPALLTKVRAVDSGEAVVVLLDLSMPAIDAGQAVSALKALSPPPRAIVAFGPHVHETRLDGARAAGCDLVISRGQFDAQIGTILERFALH
jgi:CheY-like chemotaxis protein